ncbi:MAG: hypothetical protein ACTSYK_08010 [Alphaproteobacteria bacterium]
MRSASSSLHLDDAALPGIDFHLDFIAGLIRAFLPSTSQTPSWSSISLRRTMLRSKAIVRTSSMPTRPAGPGWRQAKSETGREAEDNGQNMH